MGLIGIADVSHPSDMVRVTFGRINSGQSELDEREADCKQGSQRPSQACLSN